MSQPATLTTRTTFTAGRDLKPGTYYRAISSGTGVVLDSEQFLFATAATDKKGNRQLVNTNTGEVFYATAASIWSV